MRNPCPAAHLGALTLMAALWLSAPAAVAQPSRPTTPLAKWEQLSQAQRDQLVAPLRERWNSEPARRQRMLEHARRWSTWRRSNAGERIAARAGGRR